MKGKKILSAIIAGAMVLGTMSFPAFAASDTLPGAVNGVITLTDDVTLTETLTITSDTTIDLAGFNITSADVADSEATLKTLIDVQGATLTINGEGTIEPGTRTNITNYNNTFNTISASNGATVIIDGATVKGSKGINTKYGGTAVYASQSNVTIQNGAKIYGGECAKNGITSSNYEALNFRYNGEAGKAVSAWNSPLTVTDSEIYGGNGTADADTQTSYISGGSNQAAGGLGIYAVQADTVAVISNSTVKGGDSTLYNAENAIYAGFGSKLTVEGCTITGGSCLVQNGYGIAGAGISVPMGECEVTVTDSNVTGGSTDDSWIGSGIDVARNAEGSTIKVESSEISAGSGAGNSSSTYAIETGTPISVELKDTTLKANEANGKAVSPATGSVTAEGTLTVEGGTLNTEVFTNGGVTVSGDESVIPQVIAAKIGNTKYTTLADAIAAANSLPGEDNITIEITKTGVYDPFTITRNNVTIQGIVGANAEESTVIKNTDTNVINVYNQNITLKDLWIDDSVGHTSYKSAVNVMGSRNPYYNLTVDNCHLVGNGQVGSIAFYYHTTKLTITNCTFENFERGYYGCGDNNAMEMLTVTGNTFNNVKVPVDGYWGKVYTGSEDYNIVITDNTFNPGTWETSYIQLWDYVQYGHYLGWNSCDEGSAIKAKIANNTYNGNTVFYPTHCNVNTVTKIDIADSDKQSLDIIPRYFVDLPDDITDADITYSDGNEIDLWNTTKYKVAGSNKLLYTIPAGDFNVTVKKGELLSEKTLTVTALADGETLGENIPTITLSDDEFIADKITIKLVPTEDENVYDIVLDGNYKEIYEFVSAELQFVNNSKTLSDTPMSYEIAGTENINVIANTENDGRYGFYLKDGAEANRMTGTLLTIGQVIFPSQGSIDFGVAAEDSTVIATLKGTHLETTYTSGGGYELEAGDPIGSNIVAAARNVVVNVDFAHTLDNTGWNGVHQITVTLKDAFGNIVGETAHPLTITDNAGTYTFADVPVGRITVTLKAPGFRTYTYTTTVEEGTDPLVLTFWNDTKRDAEKAVEIGGRTMTNNFVVGDIAMDYIVDKYDLAAVTSYYGTYNLTDESKIKYDLNRDGNIDITDVAYVLHNFGF